MKRTFTIERIYHQLMKSRNVPREKLARVVSELSSQGFIELDIDGHLVRYSETEKLSGHQNKKELFKLLEKIKNETL